MNAKLMKLRLKLKHTELFREELLYYQWQV